MQLCFADFYRLEVFMSCNFIVRIASVLLLLSVAFPPWRSDVPMHNRSVLMDKPLGYGFIFTPLRTHPLLEGKQRIDSGLLLVQVVAILAVSGILATFGAQPPTYDEQVPKSDTD